MLLNIKHLREACQSYERRENLVVVFFEFFFDFLSFEGIFGAAGTLDPPQSE